MVDAELAGKAGGFFLSILGAMVLGIAVGLGVAGAMVRSRLECMPMPGFENACADILSAVGEMALASSLGGVVVLATGLLALWIVYQDGGDE